MVQGQGKGTTADEDEGSTSGENAPGQEGDDEVTSGEDETAVRRESRE